MAWLKAAVANVQSQVGDLQLNTVSQLVQDTIGSIASAGDDLEAEFDDGPLGFTMDGLTVVTVDADGQAACLGVQVGDRVIAVAGYPVPEDDANEQRQAKTARRWIKEMPRPGSITFARPKPDNVQPGQAVEKERNSRLEAARSLNSPAAGHPLAEALHGDASGEAPPTSQTNENAVEVDSTAYPEPSEDEANRIMALLTQDTASPPGRRRGDDCSVGGFLDGGGSSFACYSATPDGEEARVARSAADRTTQEQLERECMRLRGELLVCKEHVHELTQELEVLRLRGETRMNEGREAGSAHSSSEVKLRSLQDQLASSRGEQESCKRKVTDLQQELAAARACCEELRLAAARNDEVARESFEARESIIEDEVARLRGTFIAQEAASREIASKAEQKASVAEARALEFEAELERRRGDVLRANARATAAEEQAAIAGSELRRLSSAHTGELVQAKAAHDRELQELKRQLVEAQDRAAIEIKKVRDEAKASQVTAMIGGDLQAGEWIENDDAEEPPLKSAFQLGGSSASSADAAESQKAPLEERESGRDGPTLTRDAEVAALQEHVDQLEKRCCALQKKLNARPIVHTRTAGGSAKTPPPQRSPPSWAPKLRGMAGDRAADIALLFYDVPDKALKKFTETLLRRDAWLWFFYVHVFVLYTIVASFYAQANTETGAEPLDATLHEASAAVAPKGRVAAMRGVGTRI